jgi:hypothetical protein
MASTKRPRFQNKGPDWRCKHVAIHIGLDVPITYALACGH